MKTVQPLISVLVATASAGVALITLSGYLSAEVGFATLAVLGLTAFAVFDYSRPRHSLQVKRKVLRPALPTESNSPISYEIRRAA